jgi:quinolinate synthase
MIQSSYETKKEHIANKIIHLKKQKDVTILAHNYQIPEIQDISDYVGDSLGLAKEASKIDSKKIIFCGVKFMAETTSILCPEKEVLIPDLDAGCSLAATINVEQLKDWKKKNPGAVVVSYINTTAEIKAESDYCCTSANAVKIIETIPKNKEILFLPDLFLGAYLEEKTGRRLHIWPGECHVHSKISPDLIENLKIEKPDAELLIHPECGCMTNLLYLKTRNKTESFKGEILSTDAMIKYAKKSKSEQFIVGTETGMLYQLKKHNPDKKFYPVEEEAVCEYMKMIDLDKVYNSLTNNVYSVKVPKNIEIKAKKAIYNMLEIE